MKLAASITNGEAPVDGPVLGVSLGDIGIDASSQDGFVANATGEAGARLDGGFHFGHIEPTAMLGCVVESQLSSYGVGLFRRERLVERGSLVDAGAPPRCWHECVRSSLR